MLKLIAGGFAVLAIVIPANSPISDEWSSHSLAVAGAPVTTAPDPGCSGAECWFYSDEDDGTDCAILGNDLCVTPEGPADDDDDQ